MSVASQKFPTVREAKRISRGQGIPHAGRTDAGRTYKASPQSAHQTASNRLRPPRGSPATRGGGTAGAGPAREGWPLPACGEPMRIKPHQTASNETNNNGSALLLYCVSRPAASVECAGALGFRKSELNMLHD